MYLIATAMAAEVATEVAESAANAGVAASLGLNVWQFAAQLLNFGLLIFVLRLFLYKPLVAHMSERSKKISDGLDKANLYEEKLKALEEERLAVLAKADQVGREKIAVASGDADKLLLEAKDRASKYEADSRQKMAKAVEQYKVEALTEFREQAGELVVLAAEKVLRGVVTKEIDAKLVDKALKEAGL